MKHMKTKIKVGDRVTYGDGIIGVVGCIHGGTAYMSEAFNKNANFNYPDGGYCDEHKTFMGYTIHELEVISKKRGRPLGSKRKPDAVVEENIDVDVLKKQLSYGKDEVLLGTFLGHNLIIKIMDGLDIPHEILNDFRLRNLLNYVINEVKKI